MGRRRQYLNVLTGAWLFVSAFLWPHSDGQFTNTWASGLLCAVIAALSGAAPRFRPMNMALAVWLFVTAFTLPRLSDATAWNNVAVALVIFGVSLQSTSTRGQEDERLARAHVQERGV